MNAQQIGWVKDTFGVNTENIYTLEDIEIEFANINFDSFRSFYKQNSNYIGSEYKKGIDKLVFFTKLFRKQTTDNTAKLDYCESLAQKVKFIGYNAIDNNLEYENIKIKDTKENFFTDKDIKTLSKIGTLQQCVILQRSVSGTDALLDTMKDLITNPIVRLSSNISPISLKVTVI